MCVSEELQTVLVATGVAIYVLSLVLYVNVSQKKYNDSGKRKPPRGYKKPIDLVMSKIWIGNDPEESKRIQERLIELGCYWQTGKEKEKSPKYLDQTSCIFIDAGLRLTFLNTTHKVFLVLHHDEIHPSQLF